MNKTLHYLAYGSNLHPLRLQQRVPSARLLGTHMLPGYQVRFNKRGMDQSAKCNLVHSQDHSDVTHTALYQIHADDKPLLDRYEDRGNGYLDHELSISFETSVINCFTYFAQHSHIDDDLQPFHWYKLLVVEGARFHNFPGSYVEYLESHDAQTDPDKTRTRDLESLLKQMKTGNQDQV